MDISLYNFLQESVLFSKHYRWIFEDIWLKIETYTVLNNYSTEVFMLKSFNNKLENFQSGTVLILRIELALTILSVFFALILLLYTFFSDFQLKIYILSRTTELCDSGVASLFLTIVGASVFETRIKS